MENNVCSRELSKKLFEAGIITDAEFLWLELLGWEDWLCQELDENPCNAVAKMLLWLKENNYIKVV